MRIDRHRAGVIGSVIAIVVAGCATDSVGPEAVSETVEYETENLRPDRGFWNCNRDGNVVSCRVRAPTKDTTLERLTITWEPATLTAVARMKEKGKANRVLSRVRLPDSPIPHLPIGEVPGFELSQGVLVGDLHFGPSGGGFVGHTNNGWYSNLDFRPSSTGSLAYRAVVGRGQNRARVLQYNGAISDGYQCAGAIAVALGTSLALVAALPAATTAGTGATGTGAAGGRAVAAGAGLLSVAGDLLAMLAAPCEYVPGPGDYCAVFERQIHSQKKNGALAPFARERYVLAFRGAAQMPYLADRGFGLAYGCGHGNPVSGCAADAHERPAFPSRVPAAGLRNEQTSYHGFPLRQGTDEARTIGGRLFYPYEVVYTDGTNFWVTPVNFGVGHYVQDVDWQAAFDPNPLVRATLEVIEVDEWVKTKPNWKQARAFFSCANPPIDVSTLPVFETAKR
jgi:hypothetical protein